MISHARFGNLRLSQFRPKAKITKLKGWEFMDADWVGEAIDFSEWLRLESDPDVLRSLAVDFAEFPEEAAAAVLEAIDLPARKGMTAKQLQTLFGEPVDEQRFVADRVTYDFALPGPPRYTISCTVLKRGGLTYLVVMRPFKKR
jgi:hypothetical protein